MRNIIQNIGPDNTGGISKFYFIPVDDILYIPTRLVTGIHENILLKEGALWFEFQCTKETLSFKEPENITKAGRTYRQELKGYLPKDTPELRQLLSPLAGRRFVLLMKDHNNEYPTLIGTKQYYLTFESELDTKNSYAGGTGRTFSFKGESALPSCYYRGSYIVDDQGPIEPPPGGLPVTIVKGNGEVIAVVQPGGTFEINSGFSFGYRIL